MYAENWSQISEQIKRECGFSCQNCDRLEKDGIALSVHHKDRNKRNDSRANLICLCWSCHTASHRYNSEFVLEQIRKCVKRKRDLKGESVLKLSTELSAEIEC